MTATADPEDLLLEYDGQALTDSEQISQHILAADPEAFLAPGIARHFSAQAMVQSHDDTAMTATFAIVTRGKEPNRYNRFIQIVPNDHGQGLMIDEYARNPIVLYNHGFGGMAMPVGLSMPPGGQLSVKLSKNKAVATCYFSRLPHAEPIYAAVSEGLLRMASIGFGMRKIMLGKVDGKQTLPEGVMLANDYRPIDVVESMLYEWSITENGADAGALRQALDRGKIHDVRIPTFLRQSWARHAEPPKTQVQGTTFRQPVAALGVTIEGEQAAVTTAVQRLSVATAVAQAAPPSPPAAPPPYSIDPEALAAAVTQSLQAATPATVDVYTLGTMVQQIVSDAVRPIQEQFAAAEQRLKAMTGRLD